MIAGAIGAAAVVVVGVLGGAYYAAAHGGDDGKGSGTAPAAAASASAGTSADGKQPAAASGRYKPVYYNSMKSWSLWDKLNTAAKDSKPVTLDEVFGDPDAKAQKDSLDKTVFHLQGKGRLDTDCGSAVWGSALKAALRKYGCTQVVRAAYVSADKHWAGQLAVFNLKDVNAANLLLSDLDPRAGKGFLVPVSGPAPAPVDRFGKGYTGAQSGAYGHFVVVGWAGRVDGTPGDKYGTDTIAPSSSVQQAGKEFLFTRNVRA